MSYHLIDAVQQLGCPRIMLLGDVILDRYIWGDAERISQEAPVITLREERQEVRLGGAANVANMLRGLEVDVTVAGVIGADAEGRELRRHLEQQGVDCTGLVVDPSRPTTCKQRFLGHAQHRHPHQMLRIDREVRTPVHGDFQKELLGAILACLDDYQAVLISDYAKGVCTEEIVEPLIARARELQIPVIADPPGSGDCHLYRGVTAVTPNRLETSRAVNRPIQSEADAFAAGDELCRKLDLEYIFVTLDSAGIAVTHRDGTHEMCPTRRREVCDITGAGDMVLATIGIGAAAGLPPADLARLANVAGGLEVEQIGVVTISREEILSDLLGNERSSHSKVLSVEDVAQHVDARRRVGQRIVMTNGCFDLLHPGHVGYLEEAAREGDCLVVAINSDDSVRRLGKGDDRPILQQADRAQMLAALEAVDYVVIFNEDTPEAVIQRLQPDLLVKGGTYTSEEIVGRELVEAYGGEVKPMSVTAGMSTTELLSRIRGTAAPATIPHPSQHSQSSDTPPLPERKAG